MTDRDSDDTRTAAPELGAVGVEPLTRASFLVRGALATGALYGTASAARFVAGAFAQGASPDASILNFALTLEYLEADFYDHALGLPLSSENRRLARYFGDQEQEHVDALKATIRRLGGTPASKPTFSFPAQDESGFLKLAQTLEETGVGAYNGAAARLRSRDLVVAAASIVQVEARHAAAIRFARGQVPGTQGFDRPLDRAQALEAIRPLTGP